MRLASVRIITDDLDGLISFYEHVTGLVADRLAPSFAEIVSPTATLAIGDTQSVSLFKEGSAHAADNQSVIIEWQVDDVDADYARLHSVVADWVQEPTTMPWGNRSILFRDPDGNLVNLYTPKTEAAKKRFADR